MSEDETNEADRAADEYDDQLNDLGHLGDMLDELDRLDAQLPKPYMETSTLPAWQRHCQYTRQGRRC